MGRKLGQFASGVDGKMCKVLPDDILILKRQVLSQCCGLEHECEALGRHWQSLGSSLEILGGPQGRPWRSLGVPGGIPGGTKNGGCSRGASWDGPGRPFGSFWRYWVILGTVSTRQNVVISLVLDGFLRCHVF